MLLQEVVEESSGGRSPSSSRSRFFASLCLFLLSTWNFHHRVCCTTAKKAATRTPAAEPTKSFTIAVNHHNTTTERRRRLQEQRTNNNNNNNSDDTKNIRRRVLYTVTSIAEFDNGRRSTVEGYDRFTHTLLPVLRESALSIQQAGYVVDVYLITHYTMNATRHAQLEHALPASMFHGRINVWDDATPMGYVSAEELGDTADPNILVQSKHIMPITRGLARQHRYVLKDKLLLDDDDGYYDVFVSFEDDMMIHGAHVQNYVQMTNELYRLRRLAPEHATYPLAQAANKFHGDMTRLQLSRLIPGFIRVEVTRPDWKPHKHARGFSQVPVSLQWNETLTTAIIDPSVCCHVAAETAVHHPYISLAHPSVDRLYFWETTLNALSVRKMPEHSSQLLNWVLLQAGNDDQYFADAKFVIGEYWTGRDGYFNKNNTGTSQQQQQQQQQERPSRQNGDSLNNQGGWMATRRQIWEWHRQWCRGGFLPPYDHPVFAMDGLRSQTVEYWSGGIQLVGVKACNLQRIIALQPDVFGKHLLYHTSNNKQKQKYVKHRFAATHIQDFWGQLNTVKRNAERVRQRELLNQDAETLIP
jgi:hypothetical protein